MGVRSRASPTAPLSGNPRAWATMSSRDTATVQVWAKALELVLQPPFKQKMSALIQ
jgi:hypothetical protein